MVQAGSHSILSTATISAIVAIIGIIFKMFLKKAVYKNVGDIMLGFSILMVGMQTMSGAVSPLKESEEFVHVLTMFSNPLAGIIVGILFTAVLQSASRRSVFCRHYQLPERSALQQRFRSQWELV